MRRYRRKTPMPLALEDGAGAKRMKISEPSQQTPQQPVSSRLFTRLDTSTPVRSNPLVTATRIDSPSFITSPTAEGLNRSSRLGSMRSLTAAYDHARPTSAVIQSEPGEADGNLLTKAWKYLFSS